MYEYNFILIDFDYRQMKDLEGNSFCEIPKSDFTGKSGSKKNKK